MTLGRRQTLAQLGAAVVLAAITTSAAAAAEVGGAGADAQLHAQVQGRPHQTLFAVDFDRARGIAVGGAGLMQLSEDGGRSWRQEKLETQGLALLGVDTFNGLDVAVGQSGIIFRRAANSSWQRVHSGTEQRLFGVSQGTNGLAIATGAFGSLLRSTDRGQSWTPVIVDWQALTGDMAEPHLYDVSFAGDGSVFVVGEFGLILRSGDGGQSWTVVRKDEASLFAIDLRPDGVGYAVGQSGTVLRTADNGLTWSALDVGTRELLLGICSDVHGEVVIAGMREVLRSLDDGVSWKAMSEGVLGTAWYTAVTKPGDGSRARAVGQAGRLVRVGR